MKKRIKRYANRRPRVRRDGVNKENRLSEDVRVVHSDVSDPHDG